MSVLESHEAFRKIFGWQVGETCSIKLETKMVYGKIVRFGHGTTINGNYSRDELTVTIDLESKSPIPQRRTVPLKCLLEDLRT